MLDERNPPPVENLDAYNAPLGPSNGAMDAPLPAEAYGAPDLDIPEGYMATPAGIVPCIDGVKDQVADAEAQYENIPLDLRSWAYRKVPPRQNLLGKVFTTTTRSMVSAETGIGKTHLGVAIGFSMGSGKAFCHWSAGGVARVLIVDGEMSRDLLKERLADAERRLGERPCTVFVLCKEDADNMPPLDTEEGQAWLDGLIEYIGGIDFLILDNVMALTIGNMKEEDDWKPVIPWMKTLTKRRIGVLWINHTGLDKTRGYGTNTREWQMDTVMVAEKVDDPDADIAMRLSFTKSRQGKPEDKADFADVVLRLKDDTWTSDAAVPARKQKQEDYALDLLRRAIAEAGEMVPGLPASVRGVSTELWKRYCETYNLSVSDEPSSRGRAFDRARKKFLDRKIIKSKLGKVWVIQ